MALMFGRRPGWPTRSEFDLAGACWAPAESWTPAGVWIPVDGWTLEREPLGVLACPDLPADVTVESEDTPVSAEAAEAVAMAMPAPTPRATASPPTRPI